MIYMIPEEKEPISSCASELKSTFNSDLISDNNDNENNSASSIQISNDNNDSNSNSNSKQYITLPDFTKEQELK
ncbi:hypothetical protein G9A89_014527 [Geosiphon pyriformis]|nr:hypothetical protein G9A89_014527 [Geosiphon pyriformis]